MRGILMLMVLLVIGFQDTNAHGGHMATFSYSFESGHILLEFKIDVNTLDHYPMNERCDNYEKTKALCVSNYILENTKLMVDDAEVVFELVNSEQNEHYLIIRLKSTKKVSTQENIIFESDCFYGYDSTFENRVIITKNNEAKSYRTNFNSRKISI